MSDRTVKILLAVAAFAVLLGAGLILAAGAAFLVVRSFELPMQVQVGDQVTRGERGLIVAGIIPGGPADDAGVIRGDILLEIENQPVDLPADVTRVMLEFRPGERVRLGLLRGEERLAKRVEVGSGRGAAALGMELCCPAASGMRQRLPEGRFEAPFEFVFPPLDELPLPMHPEQLMTGLVVVEVIEDSAAAEAGIRQGDVILEVDGEPVTSTEELQAAIAEHQPGDRVTLTILSAADHELSELEVALGRHPDSPRTGYLGVRVGPLMHLMHPDLEE